MKLYVTLVFYTFFLVFSLHAQKDSTILSKNFLFNDGIYTDFEQLKANQPAILWDSVQANLFTNPQTFTTKIDFIIHHADTLSLDSVWGVVLAGIPYIRIEDHPNSGELTYFAGLKVRGNISYFSYPITEQKIIPIKAYNPVVGNAYLQTTILKDVEHTVEKMLQFETGDIQDFNRISFLKWIKNDEGLTKSVRDLSEAEVQEKLFKCLLIYDDRHPVYIHN